MQYEYIVGIPRGRFLPFRFGIYTLLAGIASVQFHEFISLERCWLSIAIKPSAPAVFFPWFFWVTFWMASSSAEKLFCNSFIRLRTFFQLPLPFLASRVALNILFWSLETWVFTAFQSMSAQSLIPVLLLVLPFTAGKFLIHCLNILNTPSGCGLPLGMTHIGAYMSGYILAEFPVVFRHNIICFFPNPVPCDSRLCSRSAWLLVFDLK